MAYNQSDSFTSYMKNIYLKIMPGAFNVMKKGK